MECAGCHLRYNIDWLTVRLRSVVTAWQHSQLPGKYRVELKTSPSFRSRQPTLHWIINFDWTKRSNNIKHYNPLFSYLWWSNTSQENLIQSWRFLMAVMKCSLWSILDSPPLNLSSIINLGWIICYWSNSMMKYPSWLKQLLSADNPK